MSELLWRGNGMDDIEQQLRTFRIELREKLLPESTEVIDLTDDQYSREFRAFVDNINEHRTVRRGKSNALYKRRHVEDTMALQVGHLQTVNFYQDVYLYSVFGCDFSRAMLYGQVIPGTVKRENNVHIYRLDDGTGRVEVYYPHGLPKDITNLSQAIRCEEILSSRTSLNEEQVPDDATVRNSLKLLTKLVKQRCQRRLEYFPLGTHCFVLGRPFLNRDDRVSIYAYSMVEDSIVGQSCELFWKTQLLVRYKELLHSLQCSRE